MWLGSECPMGRGSEGVRDCLEHVETKDKFEIKHNDGAMHCVIIRSLFMALSSECVNI